MTFKTAKRENAESGLVFGNPDHFAAWHTYRPAAGGEDSRVAGTWAADAQGPQQDALGEVDQDEMWFACCKSPSCARGGIPAPALGDVLVPESAPADPPWTFQGRVRNETDWGWELLFARRRRQRYGPRN